MAALVEKQIDKLFSFILPRERVRTAARLPCRLDCERSMQCQYKRVWGTQGDVRDVALMSTSIVIFVWAAAMLYRLYAYSYNAAGLRPLIQMFAR